MTRSFRALTLPAALATAVALAGCGSDTTPTAAATSATSAAASPTAASTAASPSPSCTLPNGQDLIVRDDDPQASVLAQEIGEVDLGNCTSSLDDFQQTAGQAPGECTTIAWAKDNPGYDVNAVPAPPLKDVIESAGPGC